MLEEEFKGQCRANPVPTSTPAERLRNQIVALVREFAQKEGVADILILAGYGFFVRVLVENRFASRIVEVDPEQRVITTGPYAIVRHPMYVAVGIIYILSPLALGSFWATLPALLVILVLVARIVNEEKVLLRDLPGYLEYMQRVRYRLIPGVW